MVSIRNILLALLLSLPLLLIPSVANAATCPAINWGSLPKDSATMGTGEIDTVRTGQHDCYDRLVLDIDGPPAGYNVRYVDQVTADGSGFVVPYSGWCQAPGHRPASELCPYQGGRIGRQRHGLPYVPLRGLCRFL
jgi:hypothetical protein